jgi:DNA ligase-1
MKKFPMLYKKASTGAIVEWQISVEGTTIITEWGQRGGKKQIGEDVIKEGKNIGRANATTPEEQALLEAEATWTKKLKKDYVKTLGSAEAGESSDLVEGGILPMLAKKYSEDGDKIKFPAFVQPKLDGHRCTAVVDKDGRCTLWSRTRKRINSMPHIIKDIESLRCRNITLDGELYNHAYHDKFEQLTHFIRQPDYEKGCEIVEYHIYDTATSGGFRERAEHLAECLGPKGTGNLVLVETVEVDDEDALLVEFERFLDEGYEGAMVRNADGLYVNKRSSDLQKIKKFDDAEFECVGVEEGRGKLAGHGIFVCVTKTGTEFRAKMKGDSEELKKYYVNPGLVVGKQVTIKYQGMTSKSNVPRFPVALRLRKTL